MNSTKSVLSHQQQIWTNTNNSNNSKLFDITVGGKHGAEICEVVGLYKLNAIKSKLNEIKVGIYRDDGLIAHDKNTSGPDIKKIKKKIHEYANEIGIKIELENSAYDINQLDVNLSLRNGTFYPNRKTKKEIKYTDVNSNHPQTIIRQIPSMIEKRNNKYSSKKELFDSPKHIYNEALKNKWIQQ